MVACLSGKGWDVVQSTDSGYESGPGGIPTERFSAFQSDVAECERRFGYEQIETLSATEAKSLYHVLVDVASCMRERGFPVTEEPEEAAFVAALQREPTPVWHPHDALGEQGRFDEMQRAEADCPVRW